MLEIKDISATYGDGLAIENVSLDVGAGEVVGLLGRNGAGKTTTLKSILGLVKIRSGAINFANNNLEKFPPFEIPRLGIGFVPQGNRVFPQLTVLENLLAGHAKISAHDKRLESVIENLPQLRMRLHQRAGTLSGGEQQLVAIARAQLTDAKLLLLDEPTEGLMPSLITKVEDWIRELREKRAGVLLAEQRIETALRLCDRIYVLNNGRINWEGSPKTLDQSNLKRLFGLGVE